MPNNNYRIDVYFIYEITNNINGKNYIGKHRCLNNETPFNSDYMGSGKLIKLAEKKYGIGNFSRKILAICHSELIENILEKQYIELYRSIGKAEYNLTNGGDGSCGYSYWTLLSEKEKENIKDKLREARKYQSPLNEKSILKRKKSLDEYWNSEQGIKQRKINSETNKKFKQTKGKHWFTNGKVDTLADICPEGFKPGRVNIPEVSEETRQKKREWYKNLTEEQKYNLIRKAVESNTGKHFTEERKKHIGDANRGRKYYNNGIIEVMRFECPEGFVPGRCPKSKQSIKNGMTSK